MLFLITQQIFWDINFTFLFLFETQNFYYVVKCIHTGNNPRIIISKIIQKKFEIKY